VDLGVGAGALWDKIAGYGGPRRTPGEAVEALEEAIEIMHLIWETQGVTETVSYTGRHYRLSDAQPGPRPARPIPIWLGAYRTRMLRLVGRLADGWSVSENNVPAEQIPAMQELIDRAAREAGRDPGVIRRNYNLMGTILTGSQDRIRPGQPGIRFAPPAAWVDAIVRYATELRMDTFVYWPVAGQEREQLRLFAEEVIPRVRQRLKVEAGKSKEER
jgi:alkanesulfonate monooxygenase SsuD/methylene tetrahydromethanopterin reductase-like flavin-dependent oxidoreductase (luciferase family)